MHKVERGLEPAGLSRVRATYTPKWVDFYDLGVGERPTDSHWSQFRPALKKVFRGICGYCEWRDEGEVDHFRPKTRFPKLVYRWSNWVYACTKCNRRKRDRWPSYGFVDPCAQSVAASPESYFTFDIETGRVRPVEGLSTIRRKKALNTIRSLGLNDWPNPRNRHDWIKLLSAASVEELRHFASRSSPYSSITRTLLGQLSISYEC